MNLIQINLNRSGAAHALLDQIIVENKIDLVIISEPYKKIQKHDRYIIDQNEDVAIMIVNPNIKYYQIIRKKGQVWIKLQNFFIGGVYVSPNVDDGIYRAFIAELEETFRAGKMPVVIAGDFNAKSNMWGSPQLNKRGEIVEEFIAANSMMVVNEGSAPTFVRRDQQSHLDLTLCTENMSNKIKNWKVMDEESLSDHKYISFNIELCHRQTDTRTVKQRKWRINEKNLKEFRFNLIAEMIIRQEPLKTANELTTFVQNTCEKTFTVSNGSQNQFQPKYWWNNEICEQRKLCNTLRRKITRFNSKRTKKVVGSKHDTVSYEELNEDYKKSRIVLKKLIRLSKQKAWEKLIEEINEDPWGRAYQIVTKKTKNCKRTQMDIEAEIQHARKFFPWCHDEAEEEVDAIAEIEEFNIEDLKSAMGSIKTKKAPGLDEIPNEVVKILCEEMPETVLEVMNNCLREGLFPRIWKTSRLILIPKPAKTTSEETKYRPLCLISNLGKLYERLIEIKLRKEIDRRDGLSNLQYGFRKGRSTVDAVTKVQKIGKAARDYACQNRRLCGLMAFDVQNAFNTANWNKIIKALKNMEISTYLVKIIRSYLENRSIVIGEERIEMEVNMGVPQGAVLGPLLWNVFYDGVLRIRMPNGCELIGYADDLALLATARNETGLIGKLEEAGRRVGKWITENDLKLAEEKTELLLLTKNRKLGKINVNIGANVIQSKEAIKYLGVWLDTNLRMTTHVKEAVKKATKSANAITKLLSITGAPIFEKRRLIAGVVHSVILYAAPNWMKALKHKKYRNMINSCQRKVVLRVIAAYRTVSTQAAQVIAGVPPIDLLAAEREEIYLKGKSVKIEARRLLLENWQKRWEETATSSWTKKLIPSVENWIEMGCAEVDHFVSQFLSGHGCFRYYLKRFRKAEDDRCLYCRDGRVDTAEHIFECSRWVKEMKEAEIELGSRINTVNFSSFILRGKWNILRRIIRSVISQKVKEEGKLKAITE